MSTPRGRATQPSSLGRLGDPSRAPVLRADALPSLRSAVVTRNASRGAIANEARALLATHAQSRVGRAARGPDDAALARGHREALANAGAAILPRRTHATGGDARRAAIGGILGPARVGARAVLGAARARAWNVAARVLAGRWARRGHPATRCPAEECHAAKRKSRPTRKSHGLKRTPPAVVLVDLARLGRRVLTGCLWATRRR